MRYGNLQVDEARFDAQGSIFFQRQLDFVKKQVYETLYAKRTAFQLIPMVSEAPPGSKSLTYEMFTQVGLMQMVSNYADDLPRVDVVAQDFTSFIRVFAGSYGFSTQDIRSAFMASTYGDSPNKTYLPMLKAQAAKLAYEQFLNKIAWLGAPTFGLYGLTNQPNIPKGVVPNSGTGNSTLWTSKTPAQILTDLNNLIIQIQTTTNGVEMPDTIVLPVAQWNYIRTTPYGTLTADSILKFFLDNNPQIKQVAAVPELKGAGTGNSDVMIAYEKNPMKFWMENPLPFTQHNVQERNLEFVIPCEASTAGIIIPYPLSVNLAYGI